MKQGKRRPPDGLAPRTAQTARQRPHDRTDGGRDENGGCGGIRPVQRRPDPLRSLRRGLRRDAGTLRRRARGGVSREGSVRGADRGLSGGYNFNLYDYADAILGEAGDFRLFVAGRHAAAHFRERGIGLREFALSTRYEDARAILDEAAGLLRDGEISSVTVLWQRFVNMLTQVPDRFGLLPMKSSGGGGDASDALFLPDRDTVLREAAEACVGADFYARVLEAGAGSQAATLVTMRSAYDNAEASTAELTADISRLRQSEVTSSVIETSGGNLRGRDGGSGRGGENHA